MCSTSEYTRGVVRRESENEAMVGRPVRKCNKPAKLKILSRSYTHEQVTITAYGQYSQKNGIYHAKNAMQCLVISRIEAW